MDDRHGIMLGRKTQGSKSDAAFWSGLAPRYAKVRIGDSAGYERTLERTRGLLTDQDSVLELGCGTGMTALRLAPSVGHYLATDLAPGMIAMARSRLAEAPETNVAFRVDTAETVVPPESGFDAVLAFNFLHLVDDLAATFQQIHRLVKPGGLLISKSPCLGDMNRLIRVVPPLLRLIGKAPANLLYLREHELCAALNTAGFDVEAVERHRSKKPERDKRPFIVARRR